MVRRVSKVKKNPVPASKRLQLKEGHRLFSDFSGHIGATFSIDKPNVPDVCLVVGELDAVMYTTIRDGKTEKYIHEFKSKSRPLLISSSDGKSLFILGGGYDFTERGIVDK